MKRYTAFTFDLPALRVIENEHHLLRYMMDQWHPIVLNFERNVYSVAEGHKALLDLRSKLAHFKGVLVKHFQKEEKYLFSKLVQYVGDEQGPVVAVEEEHEEIAAYIEHFLHHTEGDLVHLSLQQMKEIVQDAGEAFEIITFHFIKEESVIFPMVEEILKPNEQYALFENLYSSII